ncbi:MAG: hypothetical protein NTX61_06500 [Bacteroidetes bacterium]|nr:hypothetical protein [Bacteroidota bacterium]
MKVSICYSFTEIPGHKDLEDKIPIFALPVFTDWMTIEKGYRSLWFFGENGPSSQWLIPFSIMKKGGFKKGMFLTQTIRLGTGDVITEEKLFLEMVIDSIKKEKLCDWIQQPPNWAIFRTFPDKAITAPFGTYIVDLELKTEQELFQNIKTNSRGDLRKAYLLETTLEPGERCLEDLYTLIKTTSGRARISYPDFEQFKLFHEHFKNHIKSYITYYQGVPQSGVVFLYTSYCIYAMYAGSVKNPSRGSTLMLYWEIAIKGARENNIRKFDFVGALLNTKPGSPDDRIQKFKESLGTELKKGYIWKYIISKQKYQVYLWYLKILGLYRRQGPVRVDIIDRILHEK